MLRSEFSFRLSRYSSKVFVKKDMFLDSVSVLVTPADDRCSTTNSAFVAACASITNQELLWCDL